MKRVSLLIVVTVLVMNEQVFSQANLQFFDLTRDEAAVIDQKGTEKPFTGKYYDFSEKGTYLCKKCGNALYLSSDKFDAACGWPSFDDEIKGAVRRLPDPDGIRTEIECASCGAHLGHVFTGERFTSKNIRHCVNSLSLDFEPVILEPGRYGIALFAGGCFWGVEYYLQQTGGVLSVISGYTGGHVKNPTYQEVCTGKTGHAEVVKVVYDPKKTNYETLVRLFFEIHDPTQLGGQGPDIGNQYRSEIFYLNDEQRQIANQCIQLLKSKGFRVVTAVTKATAFYPAEMVHQDYYFRNGKVPYCHSYVKRF